MKRNMFGEPLPATYDQIAQALDELDLPPGDATAEVFDSRDQDAPFTGWTAEIAHSDVGEPRFTTCGFPDRTALVNGLRDLGINHIIVED